MNIFSNIFNRRDTDAEKTSLFGDEMRNKTNPSARSKSVNVKGFLRRKSKTEDESKNNAYIRVGRQGSVHIPSSEIAELPEVKAMQRMAMRIVTGK